MDSKNVVVLGKFDGIHIGHARLMSVARDIASSDGIDVIVYTIGFPEHDIITDGDDQRKILSIMGADKIISRPLDDYLKNMMPSEFVDVIIRNELNASYVVVGEDFRFGRNRCAGSNELFKLCREHGIDVCIVETVHADYDGNTPKPVSSTAIRMLVSKGEVDTAKTILGRPFFIKGRVRDGKHLGRRLGFPTINIHPVSDTLVPKNGVYATWVLIDGIKYNAVTNVGYNPTVEDIEKIKIETHILDYNNDCYGRIVYVFFEKFIREEQKFGSLEELKARVKKDKEIASDILNKD